MLARLFCFDAAQKIDLSREISGGVINFMAIAYIIAVNPLILNANGAGFPVTAAITATVLLIVVMTVFASFFIKLPFVLAPGMGINVIIAYTLILHDKLPIPTALGVILLSSLLLFIFSVTKIRQLIVYAIPEFLQISLSAGIGLFLIMIGLKNVGLVVTNPNTIIAVGKFDIDILLCCLGFILTTVLFIRRKVYAFLLPIILITLSHLILNSRELPAHFIQRPDFSLFGEINLLQAMKLSFLPAILSLFIVNFFDATATTMGLLSQITFPNQALKANYLKRALLADSLGGILASLLGSSPCVIFVESSAAIQNGARTGIASLITGVLCIPFIFLSPLIALIPNAATSPILMIVGVIMLTHISSVKLSHFEDKVAAVLTIIMMPFCFSITAGAIFGILSYTLLKLLLGKFEELSRTLIVIAIVCCGWFFLN